MSQTGKSIRACLLIHGFTGGPYEVLPLAQALEAEGWVCRVPALPGHAGSMSPSLEGVTCDDWLAAVCKEAEELEKAYGAFDLVGFSMGGMLAVHLAARFQVKHLVLLSAAAIYVSPKRFLKEWLDRMRAKDRSVVERIRQTPLRSTWEFMKLVRRVRPDLGQVRAPAMILQGMQDHIVHPFSARYLARRLSVQSRIAYFPLSKHLLCLDRESEQVIGTVKAFLHGDNPAGETEEE